MNFKQHFNRYTTKLQQVIGDTDRWNVCYH